MSRSPQGLGSMLAFYRGQTAARTHTHAAQVQGLCYGDNGSLCQHPARLVGKVNWHYGSVVELPEACQAPTAAGHLPVQSCADSCCVVAGTTW